jgi:hypothetical protein
MQMMHKISHLRRSTGFCGEKHEWIAFLNNSETRTRLEATKCVAEMHRFMAKLKSRCHTLTAEKLGQMVAEDLLLP